MVTQGCYPSLEQPSPAKTSQDQIRGKGKYSKLLGLMRGIELMVLEELGGGGSPLVCECV